MFVYANQEFNPEEPWDGLFRSQLLVWVSMHQSASILFAPLPTGLQAYIYLSQLSRERGQGNEIGQRSYTWNDSGHSSLFGLCSYSGVYGIQVLYFETEHLASFAFLCHRRQCSAGLTPRRIQNDSTRASWTFSMIPMRTRRLLIC
jgi:hypothetical protein